MGPRQPLQYLPVLLAAPGLALLAGQHEVRVEVVGDEGGGQLAEVELQHGGHAVDVVQHRRVPRQPRHPLLVKQGPGEHTTYTDCIQLVDTKRKISRFPVMVTRDSR